MHTTVGTDAARIQVGMVVRTIINVRLQARTLDDLAREQATFDEPFAVIQKLREAMLRKPEAQLRHIPHRGRLSRPFRHQIMCDEPAPFY